MSKEYDFSKDVLENPNFKYRSETEKALVQRAYAVAERAHAEQARESGIPYIQHPLAVAAMLTEIDMDTDTIAAGLLHDVVEDTYIDLQKLEADFGPEIAKLVDGVTKLEQIEHEQIDDRHKKKHSKVDQGYESLRKMFIAMVEDIRVVIIKLADRLHNMRTLEPLPEQRKKAFARETQEIFAPLANRLGVWQWKWELEDLSFQYLDRKTYDTIKEWISERRNERSRSIERHIKIIESELSKEGIEAEIKGRPKHIYSIHRKMERKDVNFEQVYDVRGIRIITKNVSDCYRALGILHRLWKPIPGEFDDYIAAPKDNDYQSLHTAVIGDDGKTLEVQLRTEDMHRIAERGVAAAHWRYKEEVYHDSSLYDKKLAWMRYLIEWRQEITDASEFVAAMKSDIFQDRVYTFTPRGDVIDLPTGSTPIDFAYHIHTEVGNRCRGAMVNDKLVGLDYELKTGDRVEIITSKKSSPSRDWLNPNLGYIKTTRARSKIRQWFRHQDREKNIAQGRDVVERELKTLGMEHLGHKTVAGLFEHDLDDFYSAVGFGDISNQQIAGKIAEKPSRGGEELALTTGPLPPPQPVKSIQVMGTGNLLTKIARCCNPIPDEEIIGFVTRGRGVTIHRRDCPNILRIKGKARERLVEVSWGAIPEVFPVPVCIEAYDRPGLLHEIAGIITKEGINISGVNVGRNNKNITTLYFTLEVQDIQQLARVLDKVKRLSNVTDAHRHTG